MSGIVALLHRDRQPIQDAAVWDMLSAAAHRGLDGFSVRVFDAVAFGHAKMAMTPEDEAEQQPLVSPRTGCVITADARLDNRAEVLAYVAEPSTTELSDAELILRAYERWGIDAPQYLLGNFAFFIWDPQCRQLFGARDTSGQRSLYYRVDSRSFAAASEIQQLFQDPTVAIEPNIEHIQKFLVPHYVFRNEQDQATTFYQGILAIPAGHSLTINDSTINVRPYWTFTAPKEVRYRTEAEYVEHFRDLFFGVVRDHVRTSYPTGAMLSGGLDSSTVVCTAQELFSRGYTTNPGFKIGRAHV